MTRPLVSIAIPTWNRCSMLRTALASAQAQTYEPLEIVVSDNHSDDDTVEMVRELARDDDRIRLFVNDRNIGGMNYLASLLRCRGDYIKFLNSDDLLLPHAVERLAEPLADPSVGLVIARQDWMDENLRRIRVSELKPDYRCWMEESDLGPTSRLLSGYELGNYCLTTTVNAFGCPSAQLFRRADLDSATIGMVGGRRYRVIGDVAYPLQLVAGRQAAWITESTVYLRMHDGQDSAGSTINTIASLEWLDLIRYAPALGYLADPRTRLRALRKVLTVLTNRLEPGTSDETARRVAEGMQLAGELIRAMCDHDEVPVTREGARLVARPTWTAQAPLRNLMSRWAREAPTTAEQELVLMVDENMFAVDGIVAQVEAVLADLGLDPETVPDIAIEAAAPLV